MNNTWIYIIIIFIIIIFNANIIEKFRSIPWSISTRNKYLSHDLRGDPNLIYRFYPDGSSYPDGFLYSPYYYTTNGTLKHNPNRKYYIR